MKLFLPVIFMVLLLGCAESKDQNKSNKENFSDNPVANILLNESLRIVSQRSGLNINYIEVNFSPKYVETKDMLCIVWFPSERSPEESKSISLDDRKTHVTCAKTNAQPSDPMEYNSFRGDT